MEKEIPCAIDVEEIRIRFKCDCGADINQTISDVDDEIECESCGKRYELLEPYDTQDTKEGMVGLVE